MFFPAQRLRKPTLASKSVDSSLNTPESPVPASRGLERASFRAVCYKVECRSSQLARGYLRVSRGLQSSFRVSEALLLQFGDFRRKPGYG